MLPLLISHLSIASSIGAGQSATSSALRSGTSGLRACGFETVALPTYVGQVEALDACELPKALAAFDCRNNRLAEMALSQDGFRDAVAAAVAKHGARRIGLFLGTSTSGILQAELAYQSARCDDRGIAGGLRLSPDAQYGFARRVSSATAWYRRRYRLLCPAPAHRPPRFSAAPHA